MRIMKPLAISIMLLNLSISALAADFCGYQPGLKSLGTNDTSADNFNTRAQAFNAARNACSASFCSHSKQVTCARYFKQRMEDCITAESDVKNKNTNAHKQARDHCLNDYPWLQTKTWPSGFKDESYLSCGYSTQSYHDESPNQTATSLVTLFTNAAQQCANNSEAKQKYNQWSSNCKDATSGGTTSSEFMQTCGQPYQNWAIGSNAVFCNKTPKPDFHCP